MKELLPVIAGIEGEWIDLYGRKVFKHKIDDTKYVPTHAFYGGNGTWYLMIETDGFSWLWDGYTTEG